MWVRFARTLSHETLVYRHSERSGESPPARDPRFARNDTVMNQWGSEAWYTHLQTALSGLPYLRGCCAFDASNAQRAVRKCSWRNGIDVVATDFWSGARCAPARAKTQHSKGGVT